VLGKEGLMEIEFPPISPSLTAKVRIRVKNKDIDSTYHLKANKPSAGIVIQEFGYKIADMHTQVQFRLSIKNLSAGRLSIKVN
jgi:hypothetical protein